MAKVTHFISCIFYDKEKTWRTEFKMADKGSIALSTPTRKEEL